LKMGAAKAAGHSPNHAALATRKVCQNDEFLDIWAALTRPGPSHISAGSYGGDSAYFAALFAVEPRIAEFPLIRRMTPGPGCLPRCVTVS
jgi:hypothetical protein